MVSTEESPKKVLLNVRELADLYALKTLYDYLTGSLKEAELYFSGELDSDRAKQVLNKAPRTIHSKTIDAVVSCYSDISSGSIGKGHNLEVDIALLKNAVNAMTEKEKDDLRAEYGILREKPIVVVGYSNTNPDLERLVSEIADRAIVFLMGCAPQKITEKQSVKVVTQHGVLKDYYAMADLSINGDNICPTSSPLHNFVEATEGGPLFMIPSSNVAQYGYRQLANLGVIKECPDFDHLVKAVKNYVKDFKRTMEHTDKRTAHLVATRAKYLPAILSLIDFMLGRVKDPQKPDSADLNVQQERYRIRIVHPDSRWGGSLTPVETPVFYEPTEKIESFTPLQASKIGTFIQKAMPPLQPLSPIGTYTSGWVHINHGFVGLDQSGSMPIKNQFSKPTPDPEVEFDTNQWWGTTGFFSKGAFLGVRSEKKLFVIDDSLNRFPNSLLPDEIKIFPSLPKKHYSLLPYQDQKEKAFLKEIIKIPNNLEENKKFTLKTSNQLILNLNSPKTIYTYL